MTRQLSFNESPLDLNPIQPKRLPSGRGFLENVMCDIICSVFLNKAAFCRAGHNLIQWPWIPYLTSGVHMWDILCRMIYAL